MQLFELFATLSLNSRGFESALGGATGKLGGLMKSLGATTLAIQGVEQGFQKMSALVTKSIDSFADYEQLVGGVETLFKGSAGKVQSYADEAYKTAGISANAYMDTVTSFSASLISSLEGDTNEAADVANQAIIDMSDNVNKMGSDMESVQNAYRGFAKGNFTMLDNLKLGYGGTKQEMERLLKDATKLTGIEYDIDNFADITKAIHVIQDDLGITGTTAKEAATTISGSKASLQAAFDNLLTSVSMADPAIFNEKMSEFQSSFLGYVEGNFLPALEKAIGGSGALVHGILSTITQIDTSEGAVLAANAEGSLTEVFKGLTDLGSWLIDGLANIFTDKSVTVEGATKLGAAIGEFVGTAISDVITNAPELVGGLFTAGLNLAGSFIDGLFGGLFGNGKSEAEEAADIIQEEYVNTIIDAEQKSSKMNMIAKKFEELADQFGGGAAYTKEWARAMEELEDVAPDLAQRFKEEQTPISEYAAQTREAATATRELAIEQAKMTALASSRELAATTRANYMEQLGISTAAEQNIADYTSQLMSYVMQGVQEDWTGIDYTPERIAEEYDLMSKMWIENFASGGKGALMTENSFNLLSDDEQLSVIGILSNIVDEMDRKESADEQLPDLKEQMEFAQAQLESREKAIEDGINASANAAGSSIENGGDSVENALTSVANKIGAVPFPRSHYIQEYAIGSDYIPYDQYAYIHKGEAVLTAAEASSYRRGGRYSAPVDYGRIGDMIADSLGSVGLYVSGDRVANLTTDRMQANISQRKNHTLRGMGG